MASKPSASLQIAIALIGLIGVVATAMLANWDKIFGHSQPPAQANKKASDQNPSEQPNEDKTPKTKTKGTFGRKTVSTGTPQVTLYFQTADQSGSKVYWPNSQEDRAVYLAQLSDNNTLYFAGCEVLPRSQQKNCDPRSNWIKVNIQELQCTSVQSCTKDKYTVKADLKTIVESELTWSSSGEQLPHIPGEAQKPATESNQVMLYFQTQVADQTVYDANSASSRTNLLTLLSDDDTLYFRGCDLLPESRRAQCGSNNNWKMLSPQSVGCASVKTCTQEKYIVPDDLRGFVLAHLKTASGQPLP